MRRRGAKLIVLLGSQQGGVTQSIDTTDQTTFYGTVTFDYNQYFVPTGDAFTHWK
jgi:hypothetical protein